MRTFPAALVALSACSFGMKSVDPKWDGTSEPECSDNVAPVVIDALTAGVLIGMGAIEGDKSTAANNAGMSNSGADALALVGLGGGLVFAISAAVGEHTYKQCDNAYAAWRIGGAIHGASSSEDAQREAREFEQRHHAELVAVQKSEATGAPVEVPRGFFCAASPSQPNAGFCVRDKEACVRSRDAAIMAIADIAVCTLEETAWCTGERCAPSESACEARRDHMGSDAAECSEEK